jgi:sporulation protein YlmC with PRC-barrel domain
MELQKDAMIVTHDGHEVGHLDRVAINPRSKEVTHLVVRKGKLFPVDKVVEMTYVDEVTADRITLRPEAGDPQYLPPFHVKYYVGTSAPLAPKDDLGGLGRTYAPKGYWTAPAGDIGGLGGVPLRGIPDSALPLPNLPPAGTEVEQEQNIPDTTVALKEGAKVVAEDGSPVGSLVRVLADEATGQATHFVIAHGPIGQDHKAIPMNWVGDVKEKEVTLLVAADVLDQLGAYEGS